MSTKTHIEGASRRQLLLGLATLGVASAAGMATSNVNVMAAAQAFSDWFRLGIASGSPTDTSVVLWTRLAPLDTSELARAKRGEGIVVQWEIADDDRFTKGLRAGTTLATPALGYSVHVELADLAPDRWFFYRFRVGDQTSPMGRTRTLPGPTAVVRQFRMAYASCQNADQGYWAAWRHMQAEQLDAVLFLGDYIYEYPMMGRFGHARALQWAYDLESYRERYAIYKANVDLQAMHAQVPWMFTWDDHELQNDYAGLEPGFSGPPGVDFVARRAAAYQAYYENMPIPFSRLTKGLRALAVGGELRLYQQQRIGQLFNLYLLDVRQYKDPTPCTSIERRGKSRVSPDQCGAWNDSQRSMLGMAQEAWLNQSLANAQRPTASTIWNVLAQASLFGKRDNQPGQGETYFYEGWDAYDGARRRLTNTLVQQKVANPVMLGGDVHEHWAGHLVADYHRPGSAKVGIELTGTSISSRAGRSGNNVDLLADNPHFVYTNADKRGYGVLQLTPSLLSADLKGLDDVSEANSGIQSLAKFVAQAGRPVLEKG
jgi:alkaline phosphatase D